MNSMTEVMEWMESVLMVSVSLNNTGDNPIPKDTKMMTSLKSIQWSHADFLG